MPGMWYDANTLRLYFADGTFWYMGCISEGAEADTGTYYLTVPRDTNGNQVILRYKAGIGVSWANSSARIDLGRLRNARVQGAARCPRLY